MKLLPNAARLITSRADIGEPLTVAFVKSQRLVFHNDDDALYALWIGEARMHAEKLSGRRYMSQQWEYKYPSFPSSKGSLYLPLDARPIQSIESIFYTNTAGEETQFGTFSGSPAVPAEYFLIRDENRPRVALRLNQQWPVTAPVDGAVTITLNCGYGSAVDDVPEFYRGAMLTLIGHFDENREEVVVGDRATAVQIPLGIQDLLRTPRGA